MNGELENPRCKAGLIWFRVKTSGEEIVHMVRNLRVP